MSRQRIPTFPSSIHNYHNPSALHILQRPLWPSPMIPLSPFHLQGRHFTPSQSISTQFQQPRSSLPANPTHPNLCKKYSHLSSGFQTVGSSSKSGAVYMRAFQSAASTSSSFFVNLLRSHFSHFVSASAELVGRSKKAGMCK